MFYWSQDFGPIKLFFSNFMLRKILLFLFGLLKWGGFVMYCFLSYVSSYRKVIQVVLLRVIFYEYL